MREYRIEYHLLVRAQVQPTACVLDRNNFKAIAPTNTRPVALHTAMQFSNRPKHKFGDLLWEVSTFFRVYYETVAGQIRI